MKVRAIVLAVLLVVSTVSAGIVAAGTSESISWDDGTALTGSSSSNVSTTSSTVELNTGMPTTSLVSEYRLDGDYNDTANGHHLSATGDGTGLSFATGQYGKSVAYDGTEALAVNTTSHHNLGTYTVAAWTKGGSTGDFIVAQRKDSGGSTVQFAVKIDSNGHAKMTIRDVGSASWKSASGTTQINDTSWHHVSVVYDESSAYLYVDGVQEASMTVSNAYEGKGTTRVGATTDGTSLVGIHTGKIEDVRIYSQAMSSSEVEELTQTKWSGSATTSEKKFSEAVTPDLNTSHSLTGETIKVTVTGSPGTSSEETQTVTLSSNTSYDLTWSNSHQNYTIQTNMSARNYANTPSVDLLALNGTVSSSSSDSTDSLPVVYLFESSSSGAYATESADVKSASVEDQTTGESRTLAVDVYYNTTAGANETTALHLGNVSLAHKTIVDVELLDSTGVPVSETRNVTLRINKTSPDALVYWGQVPMEDSGLGNVTVDSSTNETVIYTESDEDGDVPVKIVNNPTPVDKVWHNVNGILYDLGVIKPEGG